MGLKKKSKVIAKDCNDTRMLGTLSFYFLHPHYQSSPGLDAILLYGHRSSIAHPSFYQNSFLHPTRVHGGLIGGGGSTVPDAGT